MISRNVKSNCLFVLFIYMYIYIYNLSVHPVITIILNLPDYGRMTEAHM